MEHVFSDPKPDPKPLFPESPPCLGLRHLLSHHRALCLSYRRHFESQPILSGELQCFHLYHSASEIECFFPPETLVAFGTSTDHGLRVRRIQPVHVLDQAAATGAQLVRENQRRQIRPPPPHQSLPAFPRPPDKPTNNN